MEKNGATVVGIISFFFLASELGEVREQLAEIKEVFKYDNELKKEFDKIQKLLDEE